MKEFVFKVEYENEVLNTEIVACKLHTALHRLGEEIVDFNFGEKTGIKIQLVSIKNHIHTYKEEKRNDDYAKVIRVLWCCDKCGNYKKDFKELPMEV